MITGSCFFFIGQEKLSVCFHHQGVPHKSTDPKSLVSEFDYKFLLNLVLRLLTGFGNKEEKLK
jgi:hypothetical protein